MKTRRFEIKFHKDSSHFVSVILYSSRAVMRRRTRVKGHDSTHTNACCWQAGSPGKDSCIAEIHFGADFLTLDTIIHECCHAAYHRAVVMGVKKDADNFQEWVAGDTGIITEALIALFDEQKIAVRYGIVKRRLF